MNEVKLNRYRRRMIEVLKAPCELRIEEFNAIVNSYGYKMVHSVGSHFKYKMTDGPPILIAVHHNMVGRFCVRRVFKSLLQLKP